MLLVGLLLWFGGLAVFCWGAWVAWGLAAALLWIGVLVMITGVVWLMAMKVD